MLKYFNLDDDKCVDLLYNLIIDLTCENEVIENKSLDKLK